MSLINPYSEADYNSWYIWEMLVKRDIKAFVAADWSMVADDFISEGFIGIHGNNSNLPANWKLTYPELELYKADWIAQAETLRKNDWSEDYEEALFRISNIRNIDFNGNYALVNKEFIGEIVKSNGGKITFQSQTLYNCRKVGAEWKIVGFTGYLPLKTESNMSPDNAAKILPDTANQHKTAGPYSPVLIINPGQMAIISGQAAIDMEGNVIGSTIEEQAEYTLNNCRKTLETAGYSMADVFKVNIYMTDLNNWSLFNQVYKKYFTYPLPVRTAVQTGLLPELLVEIELWAVKNN